MIKNQGVKKGVLKMSRKSYLKNKIKRKKAKKIGLIQTEIKAKKPVMIKKTVSDRLRRDYIGLIMEHIKLRECFPDKWGKVAYP